MKKKKPKKPKSRNPIAKAVTRIKPKIVKPKKGKGIPIDQTTKSDWWKENVIDGTGRIFKDEW